MWGKKQHFIVTGGCFAYKSSARPLVSLYGKKNTNLASQRFPIKSENVTNMTDTRPWPGPMCEGRLTPSGAGRWRRERAGYSVWRRYPRKGHSLWVVSLLSRPPTATSSKPPASRLLCCFIIAVLHVAAPSLSIRLNETIPPAVKVRQLLLQQFFRLWRARARARRRTYIDSVWWLLYAYSEVRDKDRQK